MNEVAMEPVIDEPWLKSCGWVAIGNTWYPPESSHARQYDAPILFWCRVDGTIRICGSEWMSDNDAPRHQLRQLCEAMGISLNEPNEQYVPEGHHVVEDGDGERYVKNK